MVATAMMAMLSVSSMMLVRTSYTAWNRHATDHGQRQAGLSVLKHIVRKTRQAKAVVQISGPSDDSGNLTVIDINGNKLVWEHNDGTGEVLFGIGTASDVLATNIETLNFVGIKADGSTTTTKKGLIHSVLCTIEVSIDRPSGSELVSTSCKAWLRSW
jgi:hypothetical protein